ncbi:MAG: hypothetical protein ACYC55_09195 [Candidatus Geothermincolia bacterium]
MKRGSRATMAGIAVIAILVVTLIAAYSVAMASGRSSNARAFCGDGDAAGGAMMRGGAGPVGAGMEIIAEQLGMSEDELREQLLDGKTIAELASEKGVELQAIIDAVMNDARERMAKEVAEEDITQKRADEMLEHMEERLTEMLENGGGRMRAMRGGMMDQFELIAEQLGLSEQELREEIRDGNSVAELAEGKGIGLQTVIDAVLNQAREQLAQEVADENITQKRADEMLEKLEERLPDMLERDMPFGGPGGGPGGRGPGGMGGPMF